MNIWSDQLKAEALKHSSLTLKMVLYQPLKVLLSPLISPQADVNPESMGPPITSLHGIVWIEKLNSSVSGNEFCLK